MEDRGLAEALNSSLKLSRATCLVFFLALCLLGCASSWDKKSGGDNSIGTARPIALGTPVTDRISDRLNDNTDWKVFEISDARARLKISLYWDDPKVEASFVLRDQFNQPVLRRTHKKGVAVEQYPGIMVREGKYYVQVVCSRRGSVYTMEISNESSKSDAPGGFDAPPPE
jgi:hypothetical protein